MPYLDKQPSFMDQPSSNNQPERSVLRDLIQGPKLPEKAETKPEAPTEKTNPFKESHFEIKALEKHLAQDEKFIKYARDNYKNVKDFSKEIAKHLIKNGYTAQQYEVKKQLEEDHWTIIHKMQNETNSPEKYKELNELREREKYLDETFK